ncbi:TetR/AcrR family transcriptional regulator [Paenibacillus sp. IHBB 3054]|uniref:TetR/AcrR family transcriptional regulator n=1 Tax=Paenibacillus sp. IHBB 3054 TaxID=3425689 RepID=UPI003F673167
MDNRVYLKILKCFGAKGTRFTTEDLARELGTSKRTVYAYFSSKDEMIEKTIDFVFSQIIQSDTDILENTGLPIQDKIRLYFQNIPDAYSIGTIIRHMDDLQRYYPRLYEKVNHHLDTIWDGVIALVEEGINRDELQKVDTVILKLMLNETLRKLLDYEFIAGHQVSFESGIKAMSDIVLYGLIKTDPPKSIG